MKILIVGSGLSGCSMARLLKDRGHDVSIIEKKDRIGGLCITDKDKNGFKYEPYGARTFHSSNQEVIEFVQRFDEFNGYTHRKGMLINGELFPFPITRSAIKRLPDSEKIFKELDARTTPVDMTNFETACISIFGETLYNLFIKNYTERMWGKKATELLADWAPKRLELREDEGDELFKDQWQGLPCNGYSYWLEKMSEGIDIKLNCDSYDRNDYDVVVYTGAIDELMGYEFGKLEYRSFNYIYSKEELEWENKKYGTINLPQHDKFIRKCNFSVLHKQEIGEKSVIQYQESVEYTGDNTPMYPVSTKENEEKFDAYLDDLCSYGNVCPLGRLGLFKYLDMDKAIEVSMKMVDVVENYIRLEDERYNRIQDIRKNVYARN